jgi:hypothetical protein
MKDKEWLSAILSIQAFGSRLVLVLGRTWELALPERPGQEHQKGANN